MSDHYIARPDRLKQLSESCMVRYSLVALAYACGVQGSIAVGMIYPDAVHQMICASVGGYCFLRLMYHKLPFATCLYNQGQRVVYYPNRHLLTVGSEYEYDLVFGRIRRIEGRAADVYQMSDKTADLVRDFSKWVRTTGTHIQSTE